MGNSFKDSLGRERKEGEKKEGGREGGTEGKGGERGGEGGRRRESGRAQKGLLGSGGRGEEGQ